MKAILIYLTSWFLFSCALVQHQGIPEITVHTVDYKTQEYLPYEFKGEDPKTCKIRVKPKPRIPFTDPKMEDPICISPEDYLKVRHLLKKRCEAKK